jgi:shikimate kinase
MKKNQRIVLIGFRGVGKTTVGKLLAAELDWEYISTDNLIEKQQDLSIKEIVSQSGWSYFRQLEHSTVKSISSQMKTVIDCGGGIIENAENMALLIEGSLIVWIDADISTITNRIGISAENRPLLSELDINKDIIKNYQRRKPIYQSYAHLTVNSEKLKPADICKKILEILGPANVSS